MRRRKMFKPQDYQMNLYFFIRQSPVLISSALASLLQDDNII
jgi:hypothetical protein